MTTLRGRAHIKIDPKGRISLPTAFSKALGSAATVFITNNLYKGYHFLDLYPQNEWKKLEKKIAHMPRLKPEVQVFQRFYLSSGESCSLDAQGRVLIPQHLREYSVFEQNIVLVGMGHKIEIWSAKNWQTLFGQIEKDYERIVSVIADLDENNK
ncbi:MAG: division/cell wall cluster transcriptional repressor MraZ [Bdellovibrionales bacterium RBG_16_40_8]|nr:MAG: division/cell wall cluster transcriptional repressor MraZ [Bdellovibrionales bacterium RBG_16_40_8]